MSADVFEVVRLEPACGGEPLCTVVLEDNMFAADVMVAEAIAFEEMKVRELQGRADGARRVEDGGEGDTPAAIAHTDCTGGGREGACSRSPGRHGLLAS